MKENTDLTNVVKHIMALMIMLYFCNRVRFPLKANTYNILTTFKACKLFYVTTDKYLTSITLDIRGLGTVPLHLGKPFPLLTVFRLHVSKAPIAQGVKPPHTLSLTVGLGAGCGGIVCRLAASGGIGSSLSPAASADEEKC